MILTTVGRTMSVENEVETGLALVKDLGDQLAEDMETCSQGRTDFQLRHFVVGQHDTPERAWMQAVLEMSTLRNNIDRALIERERIELDLADADDIISESVGSRERRRAELDKLEIEIKQRENERGLLNYVRQFTTLAKIWVELGRFTHDQVQAAEPVYWQLRLSRQAALDVFERHGPGIGKGNTDALRQAGIAPAEYHQIAGSLFGALALQGETTDE